MMTWRKSSHSAQNGACIEVRCDLSALRDSKNMTGPSLHTNAFRQLVLFVKDSLALLDGPHRAHVIRRAPNLISSH
jgi:hypothetical protein